MVNRIALTLVFTLSFLTYLVPELTVSVQLTPLILFAVLVFFRVFCSDSALRAMGSLFAADGLLFVTVITLLTIRPSIDSRSDKSFSFALLISACLILARLYMAVVPIREVLEAFFWSGILSVGIFIPLSFADLMRALETMARFSAFSFHPNLLAFVLAGYFCVMVWKFMTGEWRVKILAGLVGLVCLVIIFFASSRGSIAGIIVGCSFVKGMAILRARKERRTSLLRLGFLGATLLLAIVIFIQHPEWTKDSYAFVDQVLELSSEYRGIDSGFTGRLDNWKETMRVFADGTWLRGRGARSSDSLTSLIDNSYLVILYEIGLLPVILITWRFFSILRGFFRGYFRAISQREKHFYLACSLLIVVFLVNNVVDRYLFAVGNPYSLLAFFLFAAPTSQIGVQSLESRPSKTRAAQAEGTP